MKSSPTAIRDGLDATIAASSSHTRHPAEATRESKMHIYINPKSQSRECFLAERGELIPRLKAIKYGTNAESKVLVCVFGSGAFASAAICHSDDLRNCFAREPKNPNKRREKRWYLVDAESINADVLTHDDAIRFSEVRS